MADWKEVNPPARKADYRYKHLRLLAEPPADGQQRAPAAKPLPVRIGDVAKISMRRAAKDTWGHSGIPDVSQWGDIRVLDLEWTCPHCAHSHHFMIPESWLDEGKAVFVEPTAPDRQPNTTLSLEGAAFLRGVMAVCASLACDDQPGLACNLASRFGAWEDYRDAGCDLHDLRAFATSAGQDAIRRLRRRRPGCADLDDAAKCRKCYREEARRAVENPR